MSQLEWSKEYETGHRLVDEQHRSLFELFKELGILLDEPQNHVTQEKLNELVDRLAIYVVEHLEAEENLMIRSRYPAFQEHRAEHQQLAKHTQALIHKHEGARVSLIREFHAHALDWILDHIGVHDKKLAQFLQDRTELKETGDNRD